MKAVVSQNCCQSQALGKMLPMVMNEPTDFTPSADAMYFRSFT